MNNFWNYEAQLHSDKFSISLYDLNNYSLMSKYIDHSYLFVSMWIFTSNNNGKLVFEVEFYGKSTMP